MLAPWRESYDKARQHIKSRDLTLLTKVHTGKAIVFWVVVYGCESWTIKKAENQRIDAFELWCWKRLLTVLWTARRSNQSTLKEFNPDYSLEGLILNTKSWLFGKVPDAGKYWGQEEKGTTEDELVTWHHWLNGMKMRKLWDIVKDREAWRAAVHGVTKSRSLLSDWTKTACVCVCIKNIYLNNNKKKNLPKIL